MPSVPDVNLADRGHPVSEHPFGAAHLVSGDLFDQPGKTGLSVFAMKRQLGVSYPTVWLIRRKPDAGDGRARERLYAQRL